MAMQAKYPESSDDGIIFIAGMAKSQKLIRQGEEIANRLLNLCSLTRTGKQPSMCLSVLGSNAAVPFSHSSLPSLGLSSSSPADHVISISHSTQKLNCKTYNWVVLVLLKERSLHIAINFSVASFCCMLSLTNQIELQN